jgi:hypothetical protein
VLIWLRRTAGLVLAVAAAGGVVSFAPSPHATARAVAVPLAVPAPRPVLAPRDPADTIVYQRGYETSGEKRVLVERWVLAGTAFRERITVDGVLLADRSDGIEVDYVRREWRAGPVRGLSGDCARTYAELTDGSATELGAGVPVGGGPTTVFRDHGRHVVDVWVNTTTHRPVRCRVVARPTVMFDLVWLSATEVNLAQLVAVVPDGFRMVAAARDY